MIHYLNPVWIWYARILVVSII